MKLRWITGILMAAVLAIPAMAQADRPQPPGVDGSTVPGADNDPGVAPDSTGQPKDILNAYEEQMVVVAVQAYGELAQITQALHAGQISSDEAEHLTRRCFELTIIRLQFLDNLHQILATRLSKESTPEPEEQPAQMQTSHETLVVLPPTSSPDIPEAMAKYLELTPAQIAAMQARISEEQQSIQPLLQRFSQSRKVLADATEKRSSNDQIRKLAIEQSHILEGLIVADSRLQRDIYQILTAAQRKKLEAAGQDTAEITKPLFAQH